MARNTNLPTLHKLDKAAKPKWMHPGWRGQILTVYENPDGTWSCTAKVLATKLMWTLTGIADYEKAKDEVYALSTLKHGSLTVRS